MSLAPHRYLSHRWPSPKRRCPSDQSRLRRTADRAVERVPIAADSSDHLNFLGREGLPRGVVVRLQGVVEVQPGVGFGGAEDQGVTVLDETRADNPPGKGGRRGRSAKVDRGVGSVGQKSPLPPVLSPASLEFQFTMPAALVKAIARVKPRWLRFRPRHR